MSENQPTNNGSKKSFKETAANLWEKLKTFWTTPPKGRYMNLKEILCFGGSAFGVSTMVTVVSGMITATQISELFGIDVLHGPLICLVASVLGLLIQPIFGKLLQNTQTRWGKYKPFILLMAPLFAALAIASTWSPDLIREQEFDAVPKIVYAYCICTPTLIIWNLFQNTFYMMPGVVTPNQQERTDIWSPIGLIIGFSPTIMNVLGNALRGYFNNQGVEYMAFRYIGVIYSLVGFAFVLLLFKVKERIIVTNENKEKVGLFDGLRQIMKNKPLLIFTLALILGCVRTTIEVDAAILGKLRYATDIPTGQAIFGSLTLITGFAVTPNMILLPFMTRKFNNKTILIFWMTCNALGYAILGIIGVENIAQGALSAVLLTVLRFIALFNAIASLQPLMLSEISDYQQLKTGKRLEGFIQMFAYTLVLVFTNIGYVVIALVKKNMGYQPSNYFNVTTVSDDLMKVATDYFNLALWISAISAALMAIAMIFYPLSKKEHEKIVEQLKALSAEQHNAPIDGETADETVTAEATEAVVAGEAVVADEAVVAGETVAEDEAPAEDVKKDGDGNTDGDSGNDAGI